MAKKAQKKKRSLQVPKRATKKVVAKESATARTTARAASQYFCEFHCSQGTWVLSNPNVPPGYTCPPYLPGYSCTGSGYTTIAPVPVLGTARAARAVQNSGHYVFSGGQLFLLNGKADTGHYCPPVITMADLLTHEPELAGILTLLSQQRKIVSVTVAVKAWAKNVAKKKK